MTPFLRRTIALSTCLAFALACAAAATGIAKSWTFEKRRAALVEAGIKLQRELLAETIESRVMGATILLGLIQPTIKLAVTGNRLSENDQSEIHNVLEPLRRQFEASGTYLISADGEIRIHDTDTSSSVGLNVAFRPYFRLAMAGKANVYAAVGSQTLERGLYYAAPVHAGPLRSSAVLGVVVTKLSADFLDGMLAGSGRQAVLLSPGGVVFATTNRDWLYAMAPPITEQRLETVRLQRRFGRVFDTVRPVELPFAATNGTVDDDGRQRSLATASLDWDDPAGDWTLVVIEDTALWFPASERALTAALAGLAGLLAALLYWAVAVGRRRRVRAAARFRTLGVALEVSPLAVVITDAAMAIEWVNPQFERTTGYALAEARGRNPNILASGRTPPETYDAMRRTLATGQPWSGEFINRRKDGSTYYARVAISPVADAAGRLLGYVGLQEDVSEYKQLLARLKSQLRLGDGLKAFAESLVNEFSPELLARKGLDELVRFLSAPYGAVHVGRYGTNPQVLARFGGNWQSNDTLSSEHPLVADVVASGRPMILRQLPETAVAALAGGTVRLTEIRILPLGEGQACVGALEIGLLRGPSEEEERYIDKACAELALALTLALDVTERLAAQKALADQLAFQKVLLDTIPNPVFYKGADTRFLGFNRAYEETFAVHREELVGKRVLDLKYLPEADRIAYQREDEAMIATAGSVRKGMRIPFADGEMHETLYYVAGFRRSDGSPGGLVGTFVDISEQKETERALAAAKEAAVEATLLKSDFLANMSHEIRTPMNAIVGMSHLAMKTDLTPRQRDYLTKIRLSSQHLLGIINDILDFSKIEAGKLSIETVDFDLATVLENVATLIREKAEAKGLELIFDVAADVPQILVGDPLRLGQILINFANNAVKFTETGEIDIRVRLTSEDVSEAELSFEVRDTGIGLSQEQIERLFQSFSQADTSTTRKYGGTGLGLAISQRLATLMNGAVGVRSAPGEGSTFWFTVRLGKSNKRRRVLLPDPDLRGRHMLVVDDNDSARTVLTEMLASMSFAVEAVPGGQEALAAVTDRQAQGEPFDVVFLDWQMPDMDGIETAMKINALPLSPLPRLIMVTAYGREEVIRAAEGAGIEDVLLKPVTNSLLFDTVMRVLGAFREEVDAAAQADRSMTGPVPAGNGERLLVVEDNEINQQVALELLTDAGYAVDVAANGEIALAMVQRAPYALVLMDMQMPVMDGLAATIAIRKLPGLAGLPIVAMTANAMQQDRDKCRAVGMNEFLAKPIDPEELLETVASLIPRSPIRRVAGAADAAAAAALADGLPGLDVAGGLSRVSGNTALYRKLLLKMGRDFPAVPASIRAALGVDDFRTAEIAAHSVKGAAGNVGATALEQAAAALEKALRDTDGQETALCLPAFETALEAFVAVVAGLAPAPGDGAPEAAAGQAGPDASGPEAFGPDRPSSGAEARTGGQESGPSACPPELYPALRSLMPHLTARKPKPCASVMAQLTAMACTAPVRERLSEAARLIAGYKFAQAQEIVAGLLAGEGGEPS
ncbi:response regulator [Desulfovibrio sp. TomC]|uniref:response regulator n=1 Tax=Desulfovibrio sp. TomC TaxID=1562888 RepID=UPI000575B008|nr:response regulator [Desulfovibrio sp. TomC]KHK03707.1 sensory box histidine kinase/response regulator [Desulfovibrio sp. TomC]